MALVPAGPFLMGADAGGEEDEHPAHTVTLPAFWLDRTEVTSAAYDACVKARVCRPRGPRASHPGPTLPVTGVSWDDARAYCARAGKRLPREAEFEKAARGTDGRRFAWGNAAPTRALTVALGEPRPAPVGSRPAGRGPYGHDDLAGNVWEWMADLYDPIAYRRPSAPTGLPGACADILRTQDALRRAGKQGFTGSNPIPTTCERVLRGGAYNYPADGLRASNRVHHPGTWRLKMAGFRCARDARVPALP
jgi:formylglycine-generating enzyme required for sulfatase activity